MYYQVVISSNLYHGKDPLTYSYEEELPIGTVCLAPLRGNNVVGIITKIVQRPSFKVKPLSQILDTPPIPNEALGLMSWLADYYPAPLGILGSLFVPSKLTARKLATSLKSDQLAQKNQNQIKLPSLTGDQRKAVDSIYGKTTDQNSTWLLHGVTGSGKTRVYIECMKQTIADKKSVLVLTPEIGLTPQLIDTILTSVPVPLFVLHSNLTEVVRRKTWLKILQSNEPVIVLGPRSALFAPLKNIGLIVVDESHDSAYKQDQAPRYSALRVASKLARLHNAKLIFGSATPNINEYYLAQQKNIPILTMGRPAVASTAKPIIKLVDQADRNNFGRNPYLSDLMLTAIKQALSRNDQIMIFLNRRGSARLVVCSKCGWQAVCPRCDLALTYHNDTHQMRCHTCGYKSQATTVCPDCNGTEVIYKSIGTKTITALLQSFFPGIHIKRFDTDVASDDRLEYQFAQLKDGQTNILVGTQMLIKGHDLPQLGLVGIVNADSSMSFPDYTAEEQMYQTLCQAIGRVGRGHRPGTVIIQTRYPDNPTLQAAINGDWPKFYDRQIKERQQFGFPPFWFMLKLTCSRKFAKTAESAANKLAQQIAQNKLPVYILGPAPCFLERVNNRYRWQIIVKSRNRQDLLQIVQNLPANWTADLDPINLL